MYVHAMKLRWLALSVLCVIHIMWAQSAQHGQPPPLTTTLGNPGETVLPLRIRVAPAVQAGRPIHRVHAVYPQKAVADGVTGTVVLHAIISTDGTIQGLDHVSGPKIFEKAAKDAVRGWLYQPTFVKGEAVEVDTTIRVTFMLDESTAAANHASTPANIQASPNGIK
jgi:TonB family protein